MYSFSQRGAQSLKFGATRRRVTVRGNAVYYRGITDGADWQAVTNLTTNDFANAGWSINRLSLDDNTYGWVTITLDCNVDTQYDLRDVELSFIDTLQRKGNWRVEQISVHATQGTIATPVNTTPTPKPPVIVNNVPVINPYPTPNTGTYVDASTTDKFNAWLQKNKISSTALIVGAVAIGVLLSRR
jgi:hypothetical protein